MVLWIFKTSLRFTHWEGQEMHGRSWGWYRQRSSENGASSSGWSCCFLTCWLDTLGLVANFIVCDIIKLGRGERGDVTILPTLVINNAQYRGIDFLFSFSWYWNFWRYWSSVLLLFVLVKGDWREQQFWRRYAQDSTKHLILPFA